MRLSDETSDYSFAHITGAEIGYVHAIIADSGFYEHIADMPW